MRDQARRVRMATAWRPRRPVWLDAAVDLHAPDRVRAVREALESHQAVWVVGARSVAWPVAVSALAHQSPLRVDLAGCAAPASVQVALGQAARVWPPVAPVEARAVVAAAAGAGPFVLDFLREALPDAALVLWAPVPPDTLAPVIEVGGEDTLEGLPPSTLLAKALAALPRGADVPLALVREAGARLDERTALPVDAWAPIRDPRSASALAEALEPWLGAAAGRPWPALPTLADALALEWLSRHHPDADDAARARAAAARMWSGWHAHMHARQLLDTQGVSGAPGPAARGLLRWAEAELLDRVGRSSASAIEAAAGFFTEARALASLAALRRWEVRRANHRRLHEQASDALADARSLARLLPEDGGRQSATQATDQAAAALALSAGERLGAAALLDALDPGETTVERHGARLLSWEHALLGGPRPSVLVFDDPSPPLFDALEAIRTAEVARGASEPIGEAALEGALSNLQALGEDHAVAVALVLLGDAAAVRGRFRDAWAHWTDALRIHIHQNRAVSSSLVLRRLATAAEEAQEGELARRLRSQAEALRPG